MDKAFNLVGVIFAIIGLVFGGAAAGIGTYSANESRNMVRVEGTIVDFERGYPVVSYTVDGTDYLIYPHSTSSTMHRGSSYTLMVDPLDPTHTADSTTFFFLTLVFGGIGGVFFLIGAILLIVVIRDKRRREELLLSGLRVSATVTEVLTDLTVTVNRRHPNRLLAACRHPVTYENVIVKSGSVWHASYAPGDHVDVLFDPMDPEKYVVDVPEESR